MGLWTQLIIKHRKVTNFVGTFLVAWMISAIIAEIISFAIPSQSTGLSLAAVRPSTTIGGSSLQKPQSLNTYMKICQRNIFDSEKKSLCEDSLPKIPGEPTPIPTNVRPVKTDMAITLIGTTVSTSKKYSFATISKKGSSESNAYYISDMILGEGKVYEIVRNKVYFTRKGRKEYLEVENLPKIYTSSVSKTSEKAGSGVKIDGDKATVSRAKIEETLGDLNNVIRQARMVPHFKAGKVDGFKIFAIRRNSIFRELGLKNGDIIQRINGTTIDSVEKAIPMLQLAKTEDTITIDLLRRGNKKSLTLEIQ